MFNPFYRPKNLTREQWKARGRAIEACLKGLSIDELMRGDRAGGAPHPDVRVHIAAATTPISHAFLPAIPMAGSGRTIIDGLMMSVGPIIR